MEMDAILLPTAEDEQEPSPVTSVATPRASPIDRISTGIAGLDEVLGGGLPQGHVYLLEGESGAGKTTVGLHFVREGLRLGETTLWITLSETVRELSQIAASHGWTIDGVQVCSPISPTRASDPDETYSFFSSADVELDQMRVAIADAVGRARPTRVVFDPFSDVRHLTRDVLRYRREVLALRELFRELGCTVLLVQEMTRGTPGDLQAEALVHGYLTLHQDTRAYGGQRRRVLVHKMRGMSFRDGFHDVAIHTGGVQVYPRLVAAEHFDERPVERVSSGVPQLDALLGGGVERGSSVLIMGAAGVGKSSVVTHYAAAAARRNERAALFIFDETVRMFRARSKSLGLSLNDAIDRGVVTLCQVDSAEYSAGQFAHMVMRAVDAHGVQLVAIDSLSGYLSAMPEEGFLSAHLHELLTYLSHRNVVTLLTLVQHGVVGERVSSSVDISYIADTVLLLRYFEAFGALRRALSVVKKRAGAHEALVRELIISGSGIAIGKPLTQFHGVLSGRPTFAGAEPQLARRE
jgi:circadian clock protein KaiC